MAAAMKHMVANFSKLNKFEGFDFRRWRKKMHFCLSTMSVVYVLNIPNPDKGDDATVEQIRRRNKWVNDDYVCRDSLEVKYMVEDASSKKFLVSNFTNYKMTDSRPVMEQYNKLLGILGRFTQHKMNMDELIQVFCVIDKLSPSWKDFKHTLKHKKEESILVELGSHLRIEESLRVQDSDEPKGNNVVDPSVVNMMAHNNSTRRWRKKMHFCLSTMSVVYVLNIPNPDKGDDGTVEQIRRRNKWVNDDYVCRGIILNSMSDSLFDIYQNVESGKEP
ncbi:hypothetical protein Tco_0505534 [Tanacetum coccineum]